MKTVGSSKPCLNPPSTGILYGQNWVMDASTSNFRLHTNFFPKYQFLNAETDTWKSEGPQGNYWCKNILPWERGSLKLSFSH